LSWPPMVLKCNGDLQAVVVLKTRVARNLGG
jgi:hypothetical protein